jgi:predicted permease
MIWIDHVARDLRHAAHMLRRNPGFAAAAILSLALGIGANTAIFQLIEAVRLRPLPVHRPEALVEIRIAGGNRGWGFSEDANSQITFPLWEQIRDQQRAFSGVFAWGSTQFLVGTGPDAHVVSGLWVSGEAFPVMSIVPALGRLFDAADDKPGCPPLIVLSHAFWQAQFGADPSAMGKTLTMFGRPVPIAGVTPPEFFGLEVGRRFDIAMPTCAAALWSGPLDRRDRFWLSAMGRLNEGWTVAGAAQHLDVLSPGIFEATLPAGYDKTSTDNYRRFRLTALPAFNGVSQARTQYGDALWLLMAMTGLVLLIACVNVMNLTLARASARQQEIAVRVAIGASRQRIILQLLTESLMVAACGVSLGATFAPPLSRALVAFAAAESDPLRLELPFDWRALAFAAAVGLLACAVFGLIPALRVSELQPGAAAKADGRGLTANRKRVSMQRGLVATQVAVSLVLIFGAVLFVRSFRNLVTLETGFRREGVIFATFADYLDRPALERVPALQADVLERIRSVPQVTSAATTTQFPLNGSSWTQGVLVAGAQGLQKRSSKFTYVSPKYFDTMGMRLLAGRDFTNTDTASSSKVVVVNETYVRRYIAPASPIGALVHTVAEPRFPEAVYEVVGVVADTKYADLREPIQPIAFVPFAQHPSIRPWPGVVIRSSAPPASVMADVKRAVAELHPSMTVGFTVFETQVRERVARERLLAWLAGGFGFVAASLAVIGVYGVISYLVLRRRREFAIRLALGAGRPRVVRQVLGELTFLLAVGLALGAAASFVLAQGASSLIFGISPRDPVLLFDSMSLLATIATLAAALPAIQASRVDPNAALRCE